MISWTRTSYVQNNPIIYNDPTGHFIPQLLIAIGLILVISQIPSDVPQASPGVECGPPQCGDKNIVSTGIKLIISGLIAKFLGDPISIEPNKPKEDDWDLTEEEFWNKRYAYEDEVQAIPGRADDIILNEGYSEHDAADWASEERRKIGIKYKDLTPPDMREEIYERNREKYGDPYGPPNAEYWRDQGLSNREIVEKAGRPGGDDIIPKIVKMRNWNINNWKRAK